MILKFWAFVYRTTGFYSNYARAKEYEHIISAISEITKKYEEAELTVKNQISLEIGMWQAKNGFYRSSSSFKRSLKKSSKKIRKKYSK